jgi:hypothetical protein
LGDIGSVATPLQTVLKKTFSLYMFKMKQGFISHRFYFASSNDLLDILSNGNQPLKVAKHLTKLFDSMAKLKLRVDKNNEPLNLAYAMIAKDGEEVDFDKDVRCENQVEVWLNRLMDIMRSTIRYVLWFFVDQACWLFLCYLGLQYRLLYMKVQLQTLLLSKHFKS